MGPTYEPGMSPSDLILVEVQIQRFACDVVGCRRVPAMPHVMMMNPAHVPVMGGKKGEPRWPQHPFVICDHHAKTVDRQTAPQAPAIQGVVVLVWDSDRDMLREELA